MQPLNLPPFPHKVKSIDQKPQIFDEIRQKYVCLTPEEWVRQHFVHYLIRKKKVPSALIANEIGLRLNGTIKRCDTVIYDSFLTPIAIVEYKAPTVAITEQTFNQIARYNMALRVGYLLVSNGLRHYCCKLDYEEQNYTFLPEIPDYEHLK